MTGKIVGVMYVFGIVYLIFAIIVAIASYGAAMNGEMEAAELTKGIFKSCLFFAIFLWLCAWLIS